MTWAWTQIGNPPVNLKVQCAAAIGVVHTGIFSNEELVMDDSNPNDWPLPDGETDCAWCPTLNSGLKAVPQNSSYSLWVCKDAAKRVALKCVGLSCSTE